MLRVVKSRFTSEEYVFPSRFHTRGFRDAERSWYAWCEHIRTGQLTCSDKRGYVITAGETYETRHVRTDSLGTGTPATTWLLTPPGQLDISSAQRTPLDTDVQDVYWPEIRWHNQYRSGVSPAGMRSPSRCGVFVRRGRIAGQRCPRLAGYGTVHVGTGQCIGHSGGTTLGNIYGAWLMAHAFAAELNVSPWEALLKAVRIAAGKLAYCEWVLGTAASDLEIEGRLARDDNGVFVHPDTLEPLGVGQLRDLSFWRDQSAIWHDRLTKTSKMAIDAGVAQWQVERLETEAHAVARVLNAVLDGVGDEIPESIALKMRGIMRQELLQIDEEAQQNAIASSPASVSSLDGGE